MMTKEDLDKLNPRKLYRFFLYYGKSKIGYIHENISNNKYYIVKNTSENRDKPVEEKGFPIKLEQIDSWEEISQNSTVQSQQFSIKNNPKAKKAIIFGAGASYDFTHENVDDTKRMPLTKDIFSDSYNYILKNYSGAYDLSSEISLHNNLEVYFQNQWKKIEDTHDLSLLKKLVNSQYYIHDLFNRLSQTFSNNNKNNYFNLVKLAHEYSNMSNEFIPIISFNYDTLIEEAINRVTDKGFQTLDEYIDIDNRKIILFKPHGSCNWVKSLSIDESNKSAKSINEIASMLYKNGYNLATLNKQLSQEIEIKSNEDMNCPFRFKNYFPWILIPYKDKDDVIMPKNHTYLLEHLLSQIEEFLIIGWKGSEENFQKILQNAIGNKKITITLIEPSKTARLSFKEEYSRLLPNVKIITKFSSKDGVSFTDYIKYCNDSDKHFFTKHD